MDHQSEVDLLERIAALEARIARSDGRRAATVARIRALNPWLRTALAMTVLAIPLAAYAASVSVPYAFLNGTIADATEVNANFTSLEAGVNDNDSRITAIEVTGADITDVIAGVGLTGGGSSGSVALGVNSAQVQTRVTGTCPAGSSIRVITSGGAVTCEADSMGSGDITGVTVGSGLTGGGTSGDVVVAVAASGITSALIQDGTITGGDVNAASAMTHGPLTVNGAVNLNGALTIDSTGDIRIYDSFNGFRWYDTDELTQFAAFLISSSQATFQDYTNSRAIISSNAAGIGVGTVTPVAGFAMTTPSLHITGNIDIGLERVSATYDLTTSGSCHSAGLEPCFYGSGTVTCPVGKRLLGGGLNGTSVARYGSISNNYPNNNTSWFCASSYDISTTDTCYAICGRVQ